MFILKHAAVMLAVVACGCGSPPKDVLAPEIVRSSPARTGLTDAERRTFYHLEEGSEVFPVDWFLALDDETGAGRFADNLERFGFISDPKSEANPYGLPVGLTAAETRDLKFLSVKMLGITCGACHVGELVTPQGKHVRLDGGPARVDVSAFYRALAGAVIRTVDWKHPERFVAFVSRLSFGPEAVGAPRSGVAALQAPPDPELVRQFGEMLKAEEGRTPIDITRRVALKDDATRREAVKKLDDELKRALPGRGAGASGQFRSGIFQNAAVTLRLLRARLEFLLRLGGTRDPGGVPPGFGRIDAFGGARNLLWHDGQPASAPVSYPDLWSFDRLAWVHWDANTTSVLERNIGQALGLGAVLDESSLASTVSVVNLHQLEVLAAKIQPPRWKDIFGAVDAAKAERGRSVFDRTCASCHVTHVGELVANETMGVDPNRAENFAKPIGGRPNDVLIADLIGRVKRKAYEEKGFTPEQQLILEGGRKAVWRAPNQYAAPPLTAIWAAAPYLHNNSVPTLRDLLTEPDKRPPVFFAGRTDYDPVKLGFFSDDDGKGRFKVDTSVPGNRNIGHDFGTALTERDKSDLLEYLKVF